MDPSLVSRAQQGDEDAFGLLVVAIGNGLVAVAHRILRDVDLAKDATQQALLSIWRDLPQLRDPDRFEAWAYRVLVRHCYGEIRRTRTLRSVPRLVALEAPDPSDTHGDVHDRDQLERAFRRLSAEHRAVVVLHYYLDLSIDEIAETLEISRGTVKSRVHHAMRGLRAAIDADARTAIREIAQ
ncbi:MAG TPA: RNA polymerase sigma factor [Candidatus Limnocylindrales bacterium]|nr:RNA polymerase sigma factor [Candidatus Limnocylindrales bacterium]